MAARDNATDTRKIRRARTKDRLRQIQALKDLEDILATAGGRRWILSLLRRCRIYSVTYAGEATHETAFQEGERNIGLHVLGVLLEEFPAQYSLALTEQSASEEKEKLVEERQDAQHKAQIESGEIPEEPQEPEQEKE